MKRVFSMALGSFCFAVFSLAFADPESGKEQGSWRWKQLEPLFPHSPGTKWVYALSGKHYAHGGELQVEVKGLQQVPHLQREALLVDEVHPGVAPGAAPETLPVLYYPREGYLVKDSAHIYSNPQRTSLISTGNLGEAVAPVLPLWTQNDGTDWNPVGAEHWAQASRLSVIYRIHPEKETLTIQGKEYKDCTHIEGKVDRGDGSGYRYQEWYAPGVGLVKGVTTDLESNTVLTHKELVSFQAAAEKVSAFQL
jgi:hypothetical protein